MLVLFRQPGGFGNCMKLSAVVLLSVNLVAASQVAANAADTASFLQDALSSSPKSGACSGNSANQKRVSSAPRKRSSTKSYVAMTPVIDGVKVRPFVPGRYLPSEAELQAKKQAEIAAQQQAYSTRLESGMLSGQVSASSDLGAILAPAASYAMSRPINQEYIHKAIQKVKQVAKNYSSARSIPGINPVMPGQLAKLPGAPGFVPEPHEAVKPKLPQVPQPPMRSALPVQVPAPPSNVAAPNTIVPPPVLSQYEDRQLNKLVESNMPENVYAGFNGDMRSGQGNPGLAGAGPPPFPLSSIPVGGRQVRTTIGQQARFGSWHGGNSNLPQGSFHSYVPVHSVGPMSVTVHHLGASHRTGKQAMSISSHHSSAPAHHHKKALSAPKQETPPPVQAASYPPYRRYSL